MGVKKFIELVKGTLGLEDLKKSNKKKSVKRLLKKLNSKKEFIAKELESKLDKKKKKELLEEKEIILFQIKKGNSILKKLNSETKEENGK